METPQFGGRDLMLAVEKGRSWALRTVGAFSGYVLGKECGMENPDLRNQIIDELLAMRVIEHDGQRNNWFRLVSSDCVEMDWINASEEPYPVTLPLALNEQAVISPGNIIVVAGETNAGKTAFALNLAADNLPGRGGAHREVHYFNSEMGPTEVRNRLLGMQDREKWDGLRVYSRTRDFHHVVRPDGLNIVDFMPNTNDFWLVAEKLDKIHNALGHGICVVFLQKKKGQEYARGGDFTLEVCRLGLSLFWDGYVNTAKITKCKHPARHVNPDGMEMDFTIQAGCELRPVTTWEYVSVAERKARSKQYEMDVKNEELRRRNEADGGIDW